MLGLLYGQQQGDRSLQEDGALDTRSANVSLCPGLVCQGDSLRMGRCTGVDAAEEVPDREG